jgi:hypothetical protein
MAIPSTATTWSDDGVGPDARVSTCTAAEARATRTAHQRTAA